MQYLLLIYEAEEIWENKSDAERRATLARHMQLNERLQSDGVEYAGQPLMPTSTALSKELKRRGWSFVGPTTVYAFMQAMGLVNDHLEGCFIRDRIAQTQRA